MEDCIFCKIAKKEIPAEFVKETDNFVVFADIAPSAPTHLLIVSKEHYNDVRDMADNLWIEAKNIAVSLAKDRNLKGFRVANNVGEAAQVNHFHLHFLAGIKTDRKV